MPRKPCKDRIIAGYWKGQIREITAGKWCAIREVDDLNIDPVLLIARLKKWPFTRAITTPRLILNNSQKEYGLANKELWNSWVFRGEGQEVYIHRDHG